MFGEKLLDFLIAGRLQPVGQLVIGEVGLERIVAQGALVTAIGACIALGQGLLGLIVRLLPFGAKLLEQRVALVAHRPRAALGCHRKGPRIAGIQILILLLDFGLRVLGRGRAEEGRPGVAVLARVCLMVEPLALLWHGCSGCLVDAGACSDGRPAE